MLSGQSVIGRNTLCGGHTYGKGRQNLVKVATAYSALQIKLEIVVLKPRHAILKALQLVKAPKALTSPHCLDAFNQY